MPFAQHLRPEASPKNSDVCLLTRDSRLLVTSSPGSQPALPTFEQLGAPLAEALCQALEQGRLEEGARRPLPAMKHPRFFHLGDLEAKACWAGDPGEELGLAEPAPGLMWAEVRALSALFPTDWIQAVACARELLWWEGRHRFCGCCGAPLRDSPTERARVCVSCKSTSYPVISPAVIVAITKGDKLLLAHNSNFRPGLHSLIAGFVDPGETLEQCVAREALEEVGIQVGRLRYVSSQPWPHPASLMLGFAAEYAGGDLHADGKEIEGADWYSRDALPQIPGPGTVARALIDAWLDGTLWGEKAATSNDGATKRI